MERMVDKIHTPRFNMSKEELYLGKPEQPDTGRCIDIPSVDQCQKFVRQIGSNIDDIMNDVMKGDTINIYPSNQKTDGICDILKLRIQEVTGPGLTYILKFPSVICGIKTKVRPQIVCDACVFVENVPPLILTVVKHENYHDESVKLYNLQIAREIIDEMRSYIAEPFSAIYGIISDTKLKTKYSFMKSLEDIKKKTSRLCVPASLQVTTTKLKCIIRAFLMVTALSNQILDDNSWWVLTREQYSILTENIEKRDVKVRAFPGSGGKVLLREVARRLETIGSTLLVLETEEQCQEARKLKPCRHIMTQNEFLPYLKKKRPVEEVTNLVTNFNCPRPDWINGVMWTITPGNEDKSFFPHGKEDNGFLRHGEEATGSVFQGKADKDSELPMTMDNISEPKNLTDGQNVTLEVNKVAVQPLLENLEETVNQLRQDVNRNSLCLAEMMESTTIQKKLTQKSATPRRHSEDRGSSFKPKLPPKNITGIAEHVFALAKLCQRESELYNENAETMTEKREKLTQKSAEPHLIHKDLSRTPSSVSGYAKDSGRSSVISNLSEWDSSVSIENIPPNITGSMQQLSAMAKLSQSLSELYNENAETMTEKREKLTQKSAEPHLILKDLSRTPSSVSGYAKDSVPSIVISDLSEWDSSVSPENIPPNITGSMQQLSAMAKLSQSLSEEDTDFAEKMTETGQNLNMPYSTPFDPTSRDKSYQTDSRQLGSSWDSFDNVADSKGLSTLHPKMNKSMSERNLVKKETGLKNFVKKTLGLSTKK